MPAGDGKLAVAYLQVVSLTSIPQEDMLPRKLRVTGRLEIFDSYRHIYY